MCGVVFDGESAELIEDLSSFAGDTAGSCPWRAAAVGGEREWQLHSQDGGWCSLPVEDCAAESVRALSAVTSLTDSEVETFE